MLQPIPTQANLSALRHALRVGAVFLLLDLFLFFPVLVSGGYLSPADGLTQFIPNFLSPWSLWTPDLFCGFPLFADSQSQLWYPVAQLCRLLPGGWNLFVLSAYWIAAMGAYTYVYTVTKHHASAIVAGMAYGFGGFFVAHNVHITILHSACWFPFMVVAVDRLVAVGGRWWFGCTAGATALSVLGGQPQIAFYALVVTALYGVVMGWHGPVTNGLKRVGTTGLALILGVGLSAVVLIPMAELASLSNRSEMSFEQFLLGQCPPSQLFSFVFPFLLGGPTQSWLRLPYVGAGNFPELACYVGLVPLALAFSALAARRTRRVVFWFATLVVCGLLVIGDATPVARTAFAAPIYNRFRMPVRHFFQMGFALAVLGGLGLHALSLGDLRQRLRSLGVGLGVLAAAVGTGLAIVICDPQWFATKHALTPAYWQLLADLRRPGLWLPPALLACLTGALLLACWRPRLGCMLVTTILWLDLMFFAWMCPWRFDAPPADAMVPPAQLVGLGEGLHRFGQRVLPFEGIIGDPESAPPNRSRLWGIPSLSGYSSFIVRSYSELLTMNTYGSMERPHLEDGDLALDLLACRLLLLRKSLVRGPPGPRWVPVGELGEVLFLENSRALPMLWLVGRTRRLSREHMLTTIWGSRHPSGEFFDPSRVALVETSDAELARGEAPGEFRVEAFTRPTDTEIAVTVDCSAEAMLVVSEVFYPGWYAYVDGDATAVHPVNYALRGVRVPAGRHDVRMVFSPPSLYAGAAVSLASLLMLVLAARSRLCVAKARATSTRLGAVGGLA